MRSSEAAPGDQNKWYVLGNLNNKFMVEGFIQFLRSQTCFQSKAKMRKHYRIWAIHYGGIRPSQAVAEILYNNSTLHLERKKQAANEIMSLQLYPRLINDLNTSLLQQEYARLKNWSKVATIFGVSHNGMYKHVRKLGLYRRKWNSTA